LTDVFDNPSWLARTGAVPGLDFQCTKAAVDLQNLRQADADETIAAALETLRCAAGADCTAFALLDEAGEKFGDLHIATAAEAAGIQLDALNGAELVQYPLLAARFEHLRITEYRDTARPDREGPAEAAQLAGLGLRSVLIVALHMQQRPAGILLLG